MIIIIPGEKQHTDDNMAAIATRSDARSPPTTFSGNNYSVLIFPGKVSGLIIYATPIPDKKIFILKIDTSACHLFLI
ncbi:hypothetical protein HLB28_16495 [Dickeya dadantii]|nr:hypothetical protein [Dickeya dadantii]